MADTNSALPELDQGPLRKAWADECGIDENDDRAVHPNTCGWPKLYRTFEAGWNAYERALRAYLAGRSAHPSAPMTTDQKDGGRDRAVGQSGGVRGHRSDRGEPKGKA